MRVIVLTGIKGEPLRSSVDVLVVVPTEETARIQEASRTHLSRMVRILRYRAQKRITHYMTNSVTVVFSSNDNHAMLLGIALCSLFENKKGDYLLNIFVLDGGISSRNRVRLAILEKRYAFSISYRIPDPKAIRRHFDRRPADRRVLPRRDRQSLADRLPQGPIYRLRRRLSWRHQGAFQYRSGGNNRRRRPGSPARFLEPTPHGDV